MSTDLHREKEKELKETQEMNKTENGNKFPNRRIDKNAATSRPKKKQSNNRKRPSPFRIKVGCIVALRMNPQGNQVSKIDKTTNQVVSTIMPDDSLIPVWTSPIPDRDEGLALVGKRVRCFLPKNLVQDKKKRILEGEVTAIQEYMTKPDQKPWKVDLLVDKSMLSEFPFLVRTDEDIQLGQLTTEKAKRNARLEETIRGAKKCTVRVRLSKPGAIDGKNSLKWVIQKIVPKRLFHNSPSSGSRGKTDTLGKRKADESETLDDSERGLNGSVAGDSTVEPIKRKRKVDQNVIRYVGDKDDTPEQQIANWRWVVSRYHSQLLSSDDLRSKATEGQLLSMGFVGEVLKVESMPKGSSSLAAVTIRRMMLPEHTIPCVFPSFGRDQIFDDADNDSNLFRVPVEELVVLSRAVSRGSTERGASEGNEDAVTNVPHFLCQWSYSTRKNAFRMIGTEAESSPCDLVQEVTTCHRCRRLVENTDAYAECCAGCCALSDSDDRMLFCLACRKELDVSFCGGPDDSESRSCYMELCDCLFCRVRTSNELFNSVSTNSGRPLKNITVEKIFQSATNTVNSQGTVGFGLPETILRLSGIPAPSTKPVVRPKKIGQKPSTKGLSGKKKNGETIGGPETDGVAVEPLVPEAEDDGEFKPTCARLLSYDKVQARQKAFMQFSSTSAQDRPRNLREHHVEIASCLEIDDKTNQRAERAKQRRLLKGIAAFSSFDLDTLASREPQLRFDRSGIHAWGVFADKDISSGDMIVEYRGEIIENAMAEKREKLYEAAKIGSDYMFRIDARFVCDATKVGNVARFINASCDPNCYTKIINVDGQKRIVIYAKRDIAAGDELCYDYKFPLEYDPAKRIPCHCGSSNCRGFMNWNKRYVVVGAATGTTKASQAVGTSKQEARKSPPLDEEKVAILSPVSDAPSKESLEAENS